MLKVVLSQNIHNPPMKNVVLIIKNTLHFILSLLSTWKNSFFQKKEYAIIPASNLSIQTKTRRWKSISIHRNVRSILKMLSITGWNYSQTVSLNNRSLIQKQLSWITAFLLFVSLSVFNLPRSLKSVSEQLSMIKC